MGAYHGRGDVGPLMLEPHGEALASTSSARPEMSSMSTEIPLTTLVASGGRRRRCGDATRRGLTEEEEAGPYLLFGDFVARVSNGERRVDWSLEKKIKYNGEPWAIKLPEQADLIMITTPEAVEEVTVRQFESFDKGDFQLERIEDLFGAGRVASLVPPAESGCQFFTTNVRPTAMLENIQPNMSEVCAPIDKRVAEPEQLVDLRQLFHAFTLESVGCRFELYRRYHPPRIRKGREHHASDSTSDDRFAFILTFVVTKRNTTVTTLSRLFTW